MTTDRAEDLLKFLDIGTPIVFFSMGVEINFDLHLVLKFKKAGAKVKITVLQWLCFWLCCSGGVQAIEINASIDYHIINSEFLESDTLDIQQVMRSNNWQSRAVHHIPSQNSQLWLKLQTMHQNADLNGLYISMLGSFELYHGDELIYHSGAVAGPGQNETPGYMDAYIILPEAAQKAGEHSWYLRISREALPAEYRRAIFDFSLNQYDKIIAQRYQQSLIPLVSLSGFFTIAAFYFCLWITQDKQQNNKRRKHNSQLIFSLLCLVIACWLLAENWRPLFGIPYHLQGYRLWFISICACNFAYLLPSVLIREFQLLTLNSRRIALAIIAQLLFFAVLHLSMGRFDLITGIFVLQAFSISLLAAAKAFWLKRESSAWLLITLIVCVLAIFPDPNDYLEQWFFVCFPLVIIALLYRQSINIKQLQKRHDQAIIKAENLKLQLLKRSIQPHFLLNTLTSLTEWIEQSPDIALEMVEQLADEFYALGEMVDQPLVPISEEIKLCATHLRLMSLRNNCDFAFQTHIPNPEFKIPPGILHTQVENAFSHNQFEPGQYQFELTQTVLKNTTELRLSSPLGVKQPVQTINKVTGGMGKTYVENRLQNAFGDNWQLSQQATENTWQTCIKIHP